MRTRGFFTICAAVAALSTPALAQVPVIDAAALTQAQQTASNTRELMATNTQILEQVQLNEELPMSPAELLLSLLWDGAPRPFLYYLAFIAIEWIQSIIAFYMDRERPGPLLWVPIQRFVLRWLLYYVLFATFITALKGLRVGWGKLERKGSVLGPRTAPRA